MNRIVALFGCLCLAVALTAQSADVRVESKAVTPEAYAQSQATLIAQAYGLDAKQQEQVVTIMERKGRQLQEIAALKSQLGQDKYEKKRRYVMYQTDDRIRRILNNDQLIAFNKDREEVLIQKRRDEAERASLAKQQKGN